MVLIVALVMLTESLVLGFVAGLQFGVFGLALSLPFGIANGFVVSTVAYQEKWKP